jgi:ABC-type antimicrobial peptide transport system permease subunit
VQDSASEHTLSAETLELLPEQTRLEEFWAQLRKNRLALVGLVIFGFFLVVAVVGVFLTVGNSPLLDPSLVRL